MRVFTSVETMLNIYIYIYIYKLTNFGSAHPRKGRGVSVCR